MCEDESPAPPDADAQGGDAGEVGETGKDAAGGGTSGRCGGRWPERVGGDAGAPRIADAPAR
ncbi:hypothetical protein GCM10010405_02510 [Streptomyces macrosporus]|uniref:Uncharacterized protein n=1 Tax=Streptomyces macrosporus TaxID=44032 RepID=A0ABP5WEM5_9ACTN